MNQETLKIANNITNKICNINNFIKLLEYNEAALDEGYSYLKNRNVGLEQCELYQKHKLELLTELKKN